MRGLRLGLSLTGGASSSPPAAPVLAWTSGTSSYNPTFTLTGIQVADVVQLQIDDDPAFGSTYGDDTNTVDSTEAADGQLTFSGIATLGGSTTYYARSRITRAGLTSAWSSNVSKTMDAVSAAVLYSGTANADRSQYVTVTSSFTATANNAVGDTCGVRSVTTMPTKAHFEVTINAFAASNARLHMGVADSAVVLGASAFPHIGSSSAGFDWRLVPSATAQAPFYNGATQSATLGSAPLVGDVIAFDVDTSAKTVLVTHRRSGVNTQYGPFTLTSQIPSTWTAFVGGETTADSVTINFGSSAFGVTPQTGYAGW